MEEKPQQEVSGSTAGVSGRHSWSRWIPLPTSLVALVTLVASLLSLDSLFIVSLGIVLWLAVLATSIVLWRLGRTSPPPSQRLSAKPFPATEISAGLLGAALATPATILVLLAAGASSPRLSPMTAYPSTSPSPTTTTPPRPTLTTPTMGSTSCTDSAKFVADVTIPDHTTLTPGTVFEKVWRIQNSGSCVWLPTYTIEFSGGDSLGAPRSQPLGRKVSPGFEVDIQLTLVGPSEYGTYRGEWLLRSASGGHFGIGAPDSHPFWIEITVGATPTPPAGTYKAGIVSLEQSSYLDLDEGIQLPSGPDADIWFHAESPTLRFLEPLNDGRILTMSSEPSLDDCRGASLTPERIPLPYIPVGNWICYRTSQGRYGSLQMLNLGSPEALSLTARYWTWASR